MKVYDLSHELNADMPVYPGVAAPVFNKILYYETDGINFSEFKVSCHMGTHIDCPAHLTNSQLYTHNVPVDCFMGKAVAVDCTEHIVNGKIMISVLKKVDLSEYDYVLFYTGHDQHWGNKAYFNNYVVFDEQLASYISKSTLKGIGVDTVSVDPVSSTDFTNHKLLLGSNTIIVENLTNLQVLINKSFNFYALPLKIKDGDGSPVRAVAQIIS